MRARLKNSLLIVLAVILGLGLVEAALRLFVPVRNVGPSFTRYDEHYGKRLKADFRATRSTPEFTMMFSTNSLGFRGPEPRRPLRDVVLFLGDSFTMGYGVSDGEEFPALIRAHLDGSAGAARVLNAGIGNNGNGRWIKFLRTEAARYDPKLVVMQVHGNDVYNNVVERLFELTAADRLRELPVPPPSAARRLQVVIESVPGLQHLHLIGLLRQIRGATATRGSAEPGAHAAAPAAGVELTRRLIEEALRICARNRWPVVGLLVDVQPAEAALFGEVFAAFDAGYVVFPGADERPDLYYEIDGHWRPEGHRLASRMLLEKLAPHTVADADDRHPASSRRHWH